MITSSDVERVMLNCFVDSNRHEDIQKALSEGTCVHIAGIIQNYVLRKDKLKEYENEIREFLGEMDNRFLADGGRGWTFLNMCNDKHGKQWGEHIHMEMLVVLGIGIGCVEYLIERELWYILPGGMPYIVIDLSKRMA